MSFVALAYLGAVDVNLDIECRRAIDKKEPALIQGMVDEKKVRAATL